VRFSSHLNAHPNKESALPSVEDAAEGPPTVSTNTLLSEDKCRKTQRGKRDTGKAEGGMGLALGTSLSQTFVSDLKGKTHVLLFNPLDSVAKNLMRYSPQLHFPPLRELCILSGSRIIQPECTGTENGLHHEPHLKILLRCRGGIRGPKAPPGAKAEDSGRREARADKWEGPTQAKKAATTPRPLRGEDEGEVVEIA